MSQGKNVRMSPSETQIAQHDSPTDYAHNALLFEPPASPTPESAKHSLVLPSPTPSAALPKLFQEEQLDLNSIECDLQFMNESWTAPKPTTKSENSGEIFSPLPTFKDPSDPSPESTIPYSRTPDPDLGEEVTSPPKLCQEIRLPKNIVKPIAVAKGINVFPSSSATHTLQPSTTTHVYFSGHAKKRSWKFVNMAPVPLPPKKSKIKSPQNWKLVMENPEGDVPENGMIRGRKCNYYYKTYKGLCNDDDDEFLKPNGYKFVHTITFLQYLRKI